jgi:hypothetical protein
MDFFFNYGPSARVCYNATLNEQALQSFHQNLHRAVQRTTWENIIRAITVAEVDAKMDDDAYLVIHFFPVDEKRIRCRASVITRTILRLLWKFHGLHIQHKGKTLYSSNRESASSAGWVFEAMVHDKLEQGIDIPFDPMDLLANNCSNAVYDKYNTSKVSKQQWKSSAMQYVPFTQNDRNMKVPS